MKGIRGKRGTRREIERRTKEAERNRKEPRGYLRGGLAGKCEFRLGEREGGGVIERVEVVCSLAGVRMSGIDV